MSLTGIFCRHRTSLEQYPDAAIVLFASKAVGWLLAAVFKVRNVSLNELYLHFS